MNQIEVQDLFRKFAAPLAPYAATSPTRKEGAEFLARSLWMTLIVGPEMEEETWRIFQNQANLDEELLQSIKQVYFEKMKPMVNDVQLAALRERYQLRKKE